MLGFDSSSLCQSKHPGQLLTGKNNNNNNMLVYDRHQNEQQNNGDTIKICGSR